MSLRTFPLAVCLIGSLTGAAQYGTFDAGSVRSVRGTTTLVVLDDGDSPYNRVILDAMKAHWKGSSGFETVTASELATQPLSPEKSYLMKTIKPDPEKHSGTFLSLVQGWKQKKNEGLIMENNAATNVPAEQDLAFILFDPEHLAEAGLTGMVHVYVKHLQDYLTQVERGQITDKTTADRLYQGRNRHLRDDMQLWLAKEQIDASMGLDGAKELYTHTLQIMDLGQLNAGALKGESTVGLADVVLTGDHKTKWCFRRVFNAGTGELMYLADEAALYGKKEGFISDDLKAIERAR
ncbi:MAG: hypothetical protein KDB88_00560 [Flavobacteriales bacterium]|nr:hypothetical protein [Flavobacteriales bacterium]